MMMDAESVELIYGQANHYYEINHYAEAKKYFLQILGLAPQDPDVLVKLGFCCYFLEEFREARGYCISAIENGDQGAGTHQILGLIHAKKDEYAAAEAEYLKALELDPEHAPVMGSYALLMLTTGYTRKAEALLNEAIRLEPDNPAVLHYVFIFDTYHRKFRKRKRTIEQYVNSSAEEVDKLLTLASAALQNRQYRDAREHLRQAVLLDPTNKHVIETLEMVDETLHPVFLPDRMLSTVRGRVVLFLGVALVSFGVDGNFSLFFGLGLFLFAYRRWIAPFLYKFFQKSRRR